MSDKADPAELVSLIASLNPENTPGRLAVIVRMGAEKLRQKFPAFIEAVEQAGQVGADCVGVGVCGCGVGQAAAEQQQGGREGSRLAAVAAWMERKSLSNGRSWCATVGSSF